jgi:trigger factor
MEHKAPVETAPLEFSNDLIKVKAHFKPACKVELEVEAAASIVQEARKKAIKMVGKEVTIAGFRKGKAPEPLIEKNYHKHVEAEMQKAISDLSFREAMQLCRIPILNNELKIGYNIKHYSPQEGAKLILFFETEPTIPTIDPSTVTLKTVERPEVSDKKVEETIRQVQLFFAQWTPVESRPIQEGDFVLLDVDVIEEEPARPLFSQVRFEVTDHAMAKWMKDLVMGHNKGDVLEGISVPDEDAKERDKEELTPKKVRVTIRAVETADIPELSDAFAQKMGTGSLLEMRANIETLLNNKADAHVQEKQREQVADILLNDFKFEIPHSLIEREVRFRMQQLLQDPEYAQVWNNMTNEAKQRTVGAIAEQSEKAVRMFYVCRKILADAKIKISPSNIPTVVDTPLDMLLSDRRDVQPQWSTEVHQAEAFSRLLLEKAEDYIIANAAKSD